MYEQLASILSTLPASAWPHYKLLATRFGQVDCTRPSACAAVEHNDSISLMQGICGNRHQHLYADSPRLCDESAYSFQKRHFCLFCQVQKLRAKHTHRKYRLSKESSISTMCWVCFLTDTKLERTCWSFVILLTCHPACFCGGCLSSHHGVSVNR